MKLTAGHWSVSWGRLPFPGPGSGPIRKAQLMQPFPRANCSGLADSVVVECNLAAWLQIVPGRRPRLGRRWWRPNTLIYTWVLLLYYLTAGVEKPHHQARCQAHQYTTQGSYVGAENHRVTRKGSLSWTAPPVGILRQKRAALTAAAEAFVLSRIVRCCFSWMRVLILL